MRQPLTDGASHSCPGAGLTEAYRLHHRDLLVYARRRLRNSAMAEEAVQETFLRAWRSLRRFDATVGTMRMWLFAICRNVVADTLRTRARHVRGDSAATPCPPPGTDRAIDRLDDRWHVDAALRSLPVWQREAIVEVHLRQRSYADAARDLGVPVGTVKSRVHLGLRSVRQSLAAA